MKIKHISLSPSSIALFKACPQKFIYSSLRVKEERPMDMNKLSAADWGTLMHAALAAHHSCLPVPPSGDPLVDRRFQEYVRHYPNDPLGVFRVEQKLERALTPQISLIGTSDMVDDANKVIWDHKTTRTISPKDEIAFKMRDQFIQYGWLCGWDNGFSVVVNQVSSSLNPSIKFNRIYFDVSESLISDWLVRTTHMAKKIVETIEQKNAYLEKSAGDSCGDWGGCYSMDICRLGLYEPEAYGQDLTNSHFSITYTQGEDK